VEEEEAENPFKKKQVSRNVINPDNHLLTQGTLNPNSSFRKYNDKKIALKKEKEHFSGDPT
jgi:hypothetical protein